jgi:hypothetical protein
MREIKSLPKRPPVESKMRSCASFKESGERPLFQTAAGLTFLSFWGNRAIRAFEKCAGEGGYCFEAGGEIQSWRLAMGLKWQLFSDGTFALTAEYHFDRLVLGNKSNVSGGPQGWLNRVKQTNGSAAAHKAIGELITELDAHFGEMVDLFARLVTEQSQ